MKVGGLIELSAIDTEGLSFCIYFQGCSKRCKGCHNLELQPFCGGVEMNTEELIQKIERGITWYDAVAFLGGEPLMQIEALKELMLKVKSLGLERWIYTGYKLHEIPLEILNLASVVVSGEYREDLRRGGFPASSNQIIYDRRNAYGNQINF
jgi:anaerobic ribonucleoside-triphosphate reductase activating protein